MQSDITLQQIETAIHEAWPSSINVPFENWLLRAHYGVTKRANSVFTLGKMPKNANWLTEIEKFYVEKKITPCFYMSKLTPNHLDYLLDENDYEKLGLMQILLARCKDVQQFLGEDEAISIIIEENVTTRWIELFLQLEQFDQSLFPYYKEIFSNIDGKKAYFTLLKKNEPVAVASLAVKQQLGYVANVVVDEKYRRQRLATHLLTHLANWASEQHIDYLILQVLDENRPAKKLYEQLQFIKVSESYYRMKR